MPDPLACPHRSTCRGVPDDEAWPTTDTSTVAAVVALAADPNRRQVDQS